MNCLLAVAATCVVVFSACGGEEEAAAPRATATAEKPPADRNELVEAAQER